MGCGESVGIARFCRRGFEWKVERKNMIFAGNLIDAGKGWREK